MDKFWLLHSYFRNTDSCLRKRLCTSRTTFLLSLNVTLFQKISIKRDNTHDKSKLDTTIQTVKRTVPYCTNAQMYALNLLVSKSGHYVYGWCVVKSRGDHLIPMSFCCELSLKWVRQLSELFSQFRWWFHVWFLFVNDIFIPNIRPIEFYWT